MGRRVAADHRCRAGRTRAAPRGVIKRKPLGRAALSLREAVLPRDHLVLEPKSAVCPDGRRLRKLAGLFHPPKRRATNRDNYQHLLFTEHAPRSRTVLYGDGSVRIVDRRSWRLCRSDPSDASPGFARCAHAATPSSGRDCGSRAGLKSGGCSRHPSIASGQMLTFTKEAARL
jgi:hypothetical protein